MNAIETKLKDAYLITNNIFSDDRGSFRESFNLREVQKIIGKYEFVQDCHSTGSTQLWVPPGFAHGFRSLVDKSEVLYKVTDYQYIEYERTLMWNDSDLNIDWMDDFSPVLSEKDRKGKYFIDCDKYE